MPWSSELGDVSETAKCHHNHRNHVCALPPRSDPCSWMSVAHGAPSGFAALLVGTGFVPIPRLRQRGVQFCRFSVRTPMRCMCRTWLQSGEGRGRHGGTRSQSPPWKYGVGLNAIDGGNGCREGRRDPRHSPAGCGGGRCASPAVMVLRVAMTGWPRTVPIGAVNSPCTAAGMARGATECQSLRQVNGPTACVVQRFLKVGHRGKGCCNPSFRFCCPAAVG